jgi:TRAP transporter TAXI family solute receptor
MIRDYLRTHRPQVAIALVLLIAAVLWAAVAAMRPMPPHTVVMATGPEGSAYWEVGKRYRQIFARSGIDLRLVPTAGAIENLSLLGNSRSGVSVGFIQSGTISDKDRSDLESLGTVFYEPLWFFIRSEFRGRRMDALRGRKISIGPEGSGTRELALELLGRNGIDQNYAQLLPLAPQQAGEKLLKGEIDAALMLASWASPMVRQLLSDKNVEPAGFPRADAYVALYPFLTKLTVPAGVGDLAKNRPPTDVTLFATKASLAVRGDLHPAIQYLLLEAAQEIHSRPGMFQKAGQFPAPESIDLPLSDQARQFYRSGRPFLQRHLPFWLAVLIDRLLILFIPLVGVIYPLMKLFPALYGWTMQRHIFHLYGDLRLLEQELESSKEGESINDLTERLDRLEEKANHLRVPVFVANLRYILWMHITLVRQRLKERQDTAQGK